MTIHEAIESGNLREVRRILAADPSQLHARTLDWTPLHVAVYGNRKAIAEALLDAGADINAPGPTGNTPLHFTAGSEGRCRPAMAALLIRRGANVNRLNGARESPLYRAVCADNWEHAGAAKVVRLLVQNGAIIDLRSAILWGKTKRVQELLKSGQVSRTELQEALIDACCRSGWVQGAGLLLDAGADVNAPGPGNRLALNEALGYLSEIAVRPIVELLLERGANPNIKDYLKQTALERAEKNLKHGVHRNRKVVELLAKRSGVPLDGKVTG